jgi:hypothetical protein
VAEIAAASREQSSGIEQVNKAVMQMDEMTQQNAALVEQATAASQSMADQARDLTVMMEKYQVNDSGMSVARAPMPKAKVQALVGGTAMPERRGANRPFSGKPAAPAKAPVKQEVPVAPSRAVANGNDADWREF